MKMNKLVKLCKMVGVVAIVFGMYASNSYGQETSTTDDTMAPANPLPPTPYVNAGKGYKIGGGLVLDEPGGSGVSGLGNVALGFQALAHNSTGGGNTASGYVALYGNTTGNDNTASGSYALGHNSTGGGNTASGYVALYSNTTGSDNTASGVYALNGNTTGSSNTATGFSALGSNVNGYANTADGFAALQFNTIGGGNIAIGVAALAYNTTGSNNIALGGEAANNVSGANSYNIEIGSTGSSGDSGAIRIGTIGTQTSSYFAGIAGVTLPTANEPLVCIDPPTGQLGTLNCAANGMPEVIEHQQVQIETLQKQNEELRQRVTRLEALIAKK
jgi:hypothetical protein